MAMTEKRNSSMRVKGGVLTQMLATQISDINQSYLKKQKETARRSMQPSARPSARQSVRPSCQIKPP